MNFPASLTPDWYFFQLERSDSQAFSLRWRKKQIHGASLNVALISKTESGEASPKTCNTRQAKPQNPTPANRAQKRTQIAKSETDSNLLNNLEYCIFFRKSVRRHILENFAYAFYVFGVIILGMRQSFLQF